MTSIIPAVDKDLYDKSEESWFQWFKWVPTSNTKLMLAESKILERCKCKIEKFFVPIFNSEFYLRTIIARNYAKSDSASSTAKETECENRIPLVLIHGFASGVGLWCKNLDGLSETRRVYAFDLLGFGRSSRPPFPESAEEVEDKFVEAVEDWRQNMKLDKFVLLGHSMGGFIATAYALNHPERIAHLILLDPWGFVERDESSNPRPSGVRGWVFRRLSSFRALATMRVTGPFGLNLMRKFRRDFGHIFYQTEQMDNLLEESLVPWNSGETQPKTKSSDFQNLSPYDPDVVYNYIYHINCRQPTGEDAFRTMSQMLGWAARPMLPRISQIDPDLPITFIYGGRSWIDMSSGLQARALRPNSYVDVMVIEGAGHHVYAQYAKDFNSCINAVIKLVDQDHVFAPGSENLVQEAVGTTNHVTDFPINSTGPSKPNGPNLTENERRMPKF